MQHKERVLKALRRESVDKLPKDLWIDSSNPHVLNKLLNEFGESSYTGLMDRFDIDLFRPKTPARPEVLNLCSGGGGGILLSSGADNPWPTEKYSFEENTYDLPAIYIR